MSNVSTCQLPHENQVCGDTTPIRGDIGIDDIPAKRGMSHGIAPTIIQVTPNILARRTQLRDASNCALFRQMV